MIVLFCHCFHFLSGDPTICMWAVEFLLHLTGFTVQVDDMVSIVYV